MTTNLTRILAILAYLKARSEASNDMIYECAVVILPVGDFETLLDEMTKLARELEEKHEIPF